MARALNAISVLVALLLFGTILWRVVPTSGPEVIIVTPQNSGYAINRVIHEIEKARHSIDLAIYMLSHSGIVKALKDKAAEGVSLRILFGESSDLPGEKIQGLHMKLMIIDKKVAVVGSANFTDAAFGWNQEILIIMSAKQFNSYFKEEK